MLIRFNTFERENRKERKPQQHIKLDQSNCYSIENNSVVVEFWSKNLNYFFVF